MKWGFVCGDEFTEVYKCSNCGKEVEINVEIYREELPLVCENCKESAE